MQSRFAYYSRHSLRRTGSCSGRQGYPRYDLPLIKALDAYCIIDTVNNPTNIVPKAILITKKSVFLYSLYYCLPRGAYIIGIDKYQRVK